MRQSYDVLELASAMARDDGSDNRRVGLLIKVIEVARRVAARDVVAIGKEKSPKQRALAARIAKFEAALEKELEKELLAELEELVAAEEAEEAALEAELEELVAAEEAKEKKLSSGWGAINIFFKGAGAAREAGVAVLSAGADVGVAVLGALYHPFRTKELTSTALGDAGSADFANPAVGQLAGADVAIVPRSKVSQVTEAALGQTAEVGR